MVLLVAKKIRILICLFLIFALFKWTIVNYIFFFFFAFFPLPVQSFTITNLYLPSCNSANLFFPFLSSYWRTMGKIPTIIMSSWRNWSNSDRWVLQCIQCILLIIMCLPWKSLLGLLAPCSTSWATGRWKVYGNNFSTFSELSCLSRVLWMSHVTLKAAVP